MKKSLKVIISGFVILLIGVIILLVALGLNGWKFSPDFEMNEYAAEEDYDKLVLNLDAGAVNVRYFSGDKIQISYPTSYGYSTDIKGEGSTLKVTGNQHGWYIFTWGNTIPDITVNLPQSVKFDLDIEVNAGTVTLESGTYKNVKANVNAGLVTVKPADCDYFTSVVNAGKVCAERLNCPATKVTVNMGEADVCLKGAKGEFNISAKSDLGNCNVQNQSGTTQKRVDVEVNLGDANVTFKN